MTIEQQGALDIVKTFLDRYGLSSLADWAWGEIVAGSSTSKVQLDLYDQPAFKQRFPAIDQRRAANLPPISPEEYINYEDQARQLMQAAGFPPSFYDQPDDFTNYIAKDVSLAEVSQRVQMYQQAAFQVPAETRQQLKTIYGIDEGGIAAYLADPNRAVPLLQQQFTSAQIAGQSQRQGFGQLSQSEAERLASLGLTPDQAGQAFGQVTQANELFQTLPGESPNQANRETALGVVGGDAQAQQVADLAARRRKAQFAAGGGFAATQAATTGLQSANT